ncbi:hypothetical protein J6590_052585 [Homalodisca vitripennis]|nr:hypothetical protein J6590_052585 [Homalodisca vitripennis]
MRLLCLLKRFLVHKRPSKCPVHASCISQKVFINDLHSAAGRQEHPLSDSGRQFVSSASPTEP